LERCWTYGGSFMEARRRYPTMPDYKRPPISRETKRLLDERKPDGVTYDYYIRQLLGVES